MTKKIKKKDGILKRISENFKLNVPTIGMFGGGTQPPEYRDKDGKIIPYEQTKWAKKAQEGGSDNG